MSKRKIHVPVAHVDATWLGMDESTNPMIINSVMIFSETIGYDRLVEILDERLIVRFSRFSQRVVERYHGIKKMHWESDPHFDIRSQVHHLALPAPGDTAELQRLISMLMSEPLDRTRPLWRMYLIDNVDGGCAVYARMHHAIGDGIALMRVLLSLTDSEPGTNSAPVTVSTQTRSTGKMPGFASSSFRMAGRATGALVSAARHVNTDPELAQETAREAIQTLKTTGLYAAATTANLAKIVLMAQDRNSVYRGNLTPIKCVSWTRPIALGRVKAIGDATGTTVNDVLVAAVVGGLRRYMSAIDGAAPDRDIRSTIPVNLRPANAPLTLGNKFSLVFLTLPISVADPAERLRQVKSRMDALKRSPEAALVYDILNILGMIPGPVSRMASSWFASKATCILTNVPGPRQPVYFADRRVERMMFWVPQSRGVGMGISILSYAGNVTIGLMVDEALIPEPAQVVDEFYTEFEALERVAASINIENTAVENEEPDATTEPVKEELAEE